VFGSCTVTPDRRANYSGRVPLATTPSLTKTRNLTVWADGVLLDDASQPVIVASDHGLVVGDGVFEALKITPAAPNHPAAPRSPDPIGRCTRAACARPREDPGRDRCGHGARGRRLWPASNHLYRWPGTAGVSGSVRAPNARGRSGAGRHAGCCGNRRDVALDPERERALAGVKSISYAENVRALALASANGATEAILLNTAGQVCEGTGTNVFVISNGRVSPRR
jgi:branched-chain amino acid aminotransferase